jgi:hypothetical protein
VWLHGQRIDYRAGSLSPAKKNELNEVLPRVKGRPRPQGRSPPAQVKNPLPLLPTSFDTARSSPLLRLITLLRVMHRVGGNALRGRVLTYVLGAAALLV